MSVAVADPYVIRAAILSVLSRAGSGAAAEAGCRAIGRRHQLGKAAIESDSRNGRSRARSTRIGLGEPAVWSSGGCIGCSTPDVPTASVAESDLAKSADGVHWEREQSFQTDRGRSTMEQPSDVRSERRSVERSASESGSAAATSRGRTRTSMGRSA